MTRYRIIATAGHVDHGKSSLVKVLTSHATDRLPEEQKRGITIDLGFAHMSLPDPDHDSEWSVGLIDVPGHENFVKNMVAGVGAIDLALLVTAADDCWMPQTEEHLQILEYLGVRHGLIALTKVDLVTQDDLELIIELIRDETAGTFLEKAPIIPTSIKDGRGTDQLSRAILDVLRETPDPRNIGKARLSVDRAFSMKGIGTVVTGSLTDGILKRDDPVLLLPSAMKSRVRSLQHYSQETESCSPGTRSALNLAHADLSSHTKGDSAGIRRGTVITSIEAAEPTRNIHIHLWRSSRLEKGEYQIQRPLRHNSVVRFHSGGGNIPGRIGLLGLRQLGPGGECLAQIHLERPVHVMAGDRFIIRDWPEQCTLAGGTVLDAHPGSRRLSSPQQKRMLESRQGKATDPEVFIRTLVERDHHADIGTLLATAPFSGDQQEQAISTLEVTGAILRRGTRIVSLQWWKHFVDSASGMILEEHRNRPERIGLRTNSVMARMNREGLPADFQPMLRDELEAGGFRIQGEFIHHESHRISLPENLAGPARRIRQCLLGDPMNPGILRENIHTENDRKALQFLIDSGEVVRVSEEIALHSSVFNDAVERIAAHIRSHGPATVSELKDTINATRKVMVPLLEILDGRGITRRDGDRRTLGPSAYPK